jgi:hypothetical protein
MPGWIGHGASVRKKCSGGQKSSDGFRRWRVVSHRNVFVLVSWEKAHEEIVGMRSGLCGVSQRRLCGRAQRLVSG